jgi:hypothetical protein
MQGFVQVLGCVRGRNKLIDLWLKWVGLVQHWHSAAGCVRLHLERRCLLQPNELVNVIVPGPPHVTRHTSHVTRHASRITHHTSHITHHTSHIPHPTTHSSLAPNLRHPQLLQRVKYILKTGKRFDLVAAQRPVSKESWGMGQGRGGPLTAS